MRFPKESGHPISRPEGRLEGCHRGSNQKKFTLEFRTEAAHRVIDTGRTVREVARELSVFENSLSKWVRDERRRMETLEGTEW